MGESSKSQKKNWFKSLKAEFKKIIWPGKKDLAKQTLVVLVSAVVIGIVIALIDMGIQYGIQFLMNIQF
ncbi:MAG: preprotein translocase subunit SecE [Lachnospiraceae bacterium]|nr:preprotein translocase subunit SecE [Lachnospiraceae bacterium]